MNKKIITYPSSILRRKAHKIKDPKDPKIKKIINEMTYLMTQMKGIGLAAPQIGESLQLCLVLDIENEPNNPEQSRLIVLINPKITSYSKQKIVMQEGCLSFPNKFFQIKRSQSIKVRYTDDKGVKQKIKAQGILARVIQHEIDHLNGILVIDYKNNK